MGQYDFDLFTIGAGSGGVRASRMAATKGARVAVAEARFMGGTCVNVGCVPKKLMVYAAHFAEAFEDARGFGWSLPEARFDLASLRAAKDNEIQRLNRIYDRLLQGAGCTVLTGRARIVDHHRVEVALASGETQSFSAEHILVATGGRPIRPSEPGTENVWVSDDVFFIDKVPPRMMVVGGGYIAVEMAGIFRGLGSEVHLVYRGPHPLRGFDDDARTFLCEELRKKGVKLHLNATVQSLERMDAGHYDVQLSHDETIEVDEVLYAIGREPNTANLGLQDVGVRLNARGAIEVDPFFATSCPGIWALGDVTDRLNLTPVAIAEGMALAETLFGRGPTTLDATNVPTAVFSQPPLATVGLTEAQAEERFGPLDVYTSEFRPMVHTLSGRDERSFMKLIVHPADDRVVGVHLVGLDAPEMIQGFAVALKCGATKAQLDATLGVHPTSAEELVTMRERRPARE